MSLIQPIDINIVWGYLTFLPVGDKGPLACDDIGNFIYRLVMRINLESRFTEQFPNLTQLNKPQIQRLIKEIIVVFIPLA